MDSLTKITQNIVLGSSLPAKVIAERLGKPYPTLMRELNPFDMGAKLGAETLLEIMKITRNTTPLQYMARELNCAIVPWGESNQDSLYAVSQQDGDMKLPV